MRQRDQRAQAHASLFYEPRSTPAAVADALETDIHVRTLNEFLAEQPFDWSPTAVTVLKQSPPSQICPESPCSVAFETAPHPLPAYYGPQSGVIEPLNVGTCADDELQSLWLLLRETDGNGDQVRAVKREYPQLQQQQLLQATSAAQAYPKPHSLYAGFLSQDVDKEELRKRQRMYEQKYRKKKRVSCLAHVCLLVCLWHGFKTKRSYS